MKFATISLLVSPFVLALASCGSTPEGKFQDDKKTTASGIDTVKRYVSNPAAAWQSDWSKENIVVYHWKAEPDNMHPTNGKSNPRRVIMDYTQRYLVSTDYKNLALRPDLVKHMPEMSADGLDYTYELRDEPTWDDGSQLTVDDVIFTIKATLDPYTGNAFAKPYFDYVKDLTVDPSNPRKFTIHMREKYIQNIGLFGDMAIMQKKYFDPKGVLDKYTITQLHDPAFMKTPHADVQAWTKEFNDPKYGRDINYLPGLGAYKITAWEDKQRIELTKKPNHWTSKVQNPDMYDVAYPEKIIFKIITDDNAVALEIKKQAIDVSTWVTSHGLVELQKDPDFNRNYHSAFLQNYLYQYIGMNMKPEASNRKPFFTDKRVRRAMALLTNIDQINQAYLEGKAIRQVSLVVPTRVDVYDKSLQLLTFNLEEAKKLLDEAGWKDTDGDNVRDKMIDGKKVPFEFELLYTSGNTIQENIAKDIAADMYKAGVKIDLKSLEFVKSYEEIQHHNFDMYFGSWAGSFVPEDYKQIWHSTAWADGSNYVGFGTPQSDALIDSIRVTMDDPTRHEMEKRLQRMVYDEQPYIFLYMNPVKVVIHKRFDNADMFYEKPGVYLSNLRLQSAGTMTKTATTP